MRTKKKLSLIPDARFPSELRGVTKTTEWSCTKVQGTVGKYHVKLYENMRSQFPTSGLDTIIPNFEDAKDAAKVFAAWQDMQAELCVLYRNAKMSCPSLKSITCQDVRNNVASIDKEIVAKEEELARLKCKKQADKALLVLKESFVSATKALELVSARYTFA